MSTRILLQSLLSAILVSILSGAAAHAEDPMPASTSRESERVRPPPPTIRQPLIRQPTYDEEAAECRVSDDEAPGAEPVDPRVALKDAIAAAKTEPDRIWAEKGYESIAEAAAAGEAIVLNGTGYNYVPAPPRPR